MDVKSCKDLLKTWATIAPDEVQFTEHDQFWLTGRYGRLQIDLLCDGSILPWEQDLIQGHLQRCIKDRKWGYEISGNSTKRSFKNFCQVSTGGYSVRVENKGVLGNLLAAYLSVITTCNDVSGTP